MKSVEEGKTLVLLDWATMILVNLTQDNTLDGFRLYGDLLVQHDWL
jgi:hypothetical protein